MSAVGSWWVNVYLFLKKEQGKQNLANDNKTNNSDLFNLEKFRTFLEENHSNLGMHVVDNNIYF